MKCSLRAATLIGLAGMILLWTLFATALKLPEHNIVEFELAFDTATAKRILTDWNEHHLFPRVFQNLFWDFPFIIFYTLFLFSAAEWVTKRLAPFFRGSGIAFLALAAGGLDVVENILLLSVLDSFKTGMISGTATLAAGLAALFKFLLAGTLVLYVAASICYQWVRAKPRNIVSS